MANNQHFHITGYNHVSEIVSTKSASLLSLMQDNPRDEFILWYKDLTHSDLTNRGKRNGMREGLEKNLLYYLTIDQMRQIENTSEKPFQSAKQSNIGINVKFFEELNVPTPRAITGKGYCISDVVDVYLVNDTLKYFSMDYTRKVLRVLKKNEKCQWFDSQSIELSQNTPFTKIQLSEAVHGIGIAEDKIFHQLRLSMFINDRLFFLIRKPLGNKKTELFIFLEKNPIFFTIIGEANELWQRHLEVQKTQQDKSVEASETLSVEQEKTRAKQSAWKELLAKEMMNYTTHEGEVFCPFTHIQAPFASVPMLFVASHIKRFKDSTPEEAFDINNGLLLCANADALFDKHMITIAEDKTLRFSFLLSDDHYLLSVLRLNQGIFSIILNEKRMEYLKDHRRIFEQKEIERRNANYQYAEE